VLPSFAGNSLPYRRTKISTFYAIICLLKNSIPFFPVLCYHEATKTKEVHPMEMNLALLRDFSAVQKYDSHIPSDRLRDCIRNHQVYVLRDATGGIVGVLRYSLFWQSIPFLDLLYIEEANRGKGYGRQMMFHWESVMAQLGYKYVMLSTQEDETAKYFYEKLGYHRIGAFLPPEQAADEIIFLKGL